MKVGFNASLLAAPTLRGWNRYAVNILAELSRMPDIALVLYARVPIHSAHLARLGLARVIQRVSSPMKYFAWEQRWLPRQCAIDRVDLLHSPYNFGLPWRSPCPRVLTLHDAIDADGMTKQWSVGATLNRLSHWIARRRADRVITVSQHAKQSIAARWKVPPERITVIHNAADERFKPATVEAIDSMCATLNLHRPFVLYIGGWEARKNVPFLVRAFAEARLQDVELVLIGGNAAQLQTMRALCESLGVGDRTKLFEWIDDALLPALYSAAMCFVYPSQQEGFGLQLVESMSCGCPTLAANATSLPEVLGMGGELFELASPRGLAEILQSLKPDRLLQLRTQARQRAEAFSWFSAALETRKVYASAIQ